MASCSREAAAPVFERMSWEAMERQYTSSQQQGTSYTYMHVQPWMNYETCTNPGSSGHPELCAKPCTFFAMGLCRNAADCEFCHREHPKRPPRMDRRKRELMKSANACE